MTVTRRQLLAWAAEAEQAQASRAAFDRAVEDAINGLRRRPLHDLCEQVEAIFAGDNGGGAVA